MDEFLPKTAFGRVVVAFLSAPLALSSAWLVYYVLFHWPNPNNMDDWILKVAIAEVGSALLGLSFLAFVWALATPRWMESLLRFFGIEMAAFVLLTVPLLLLAC